MSEDYNVADDSWPLMHLKLYDAGPDAAKVFSLIRLLSGASIVDAKNALSTPGYVIATDSQRALRGITGRFQALKADVRIEPIE